jgi:hypothetical protein
MGASNVTQVEINLDYWCVVSSIRYFSFHGHDAGIIMDMQ